MNTGRGTGTKRRETDKGQTEEAPRSYCLRRVSIQKPASRISQLSRRENGSIFLNTNL